MIAFYIFLPAASQLKKNELVQKKNEKDQNSEIYLLV